jgi:hypothetical protein
MGMHVVLALAIGLLAAGPALAGSESPEETLASLSRELQTRTRECDVAFQALKTAVEENSASTQLDSVAGAAAKSCGAAYDDMEVLARPHEPSYATLKAISEWWSYAHQQVFYRTLAGRAVQSAIVENKAVMSENYQSDVKQQATYGAMAGEYLQKVRESLEKGGVGKTPRLNRVAAKKLEAFLKSAAKMVSECNEDFDELQWVMHMAGTLSGPTTSLWPYGARVTKVCEIAAARFGKITVPHLGEAIEEALDDWTDAVGDQSSHQSNAAVAASTYATRPDRKQLWQDYRNSIAISVAYKVKASDAISEAMRLVGIKAKQ